MSVRLVIDDVFLEWSIQSSIESVFMLLCFVVKIPMILGIKCLSRDMNVLGSTSNDVVVCTAEESYKTS